MPITTASNQKKHQVSLPIEPPVAVGAAGSVPVVVRNDVHGRFLGGGGGTVDADVRPDQVRLVVLAEPFVGATSRPARSVAHLAVVQVLGALEAFGLGVRVRLRLLLRDPLVERLAGSLFVRRVAEPLRGRPVLRRRVAAVELVLDISPGSSRVSSGWSWSSTL